MGLIVVPRIPEQWMPAHLPGVNVIPLVINMILKSFPSPIRGTFQPVIVFVVVTEVVRKFPPDDGFLHKSGYSIRVRFSELFCVEYSSLHRDLPKVNPGR